VKSVFSPIASADEREKYLSATSARYRHLLLKLMTLEDKHEQETCIIDERQPTSDSFHQPSASETHIRCLTS